MYGPTLPISQEVHKNKYRMKDESFEEAIDRITTTLKDSEGHYHTIKKILLSMRFLPAGRVQAAIGSPKKVTALNCFMSEDIEDSFDGIMHSVTEAGKTMRMGGGVGYNFSTLRPRGDLIKSLDSQSSGPLSFMNIHNAMCLAICSAGHRRGAQMGLLEVWHPDIEEFILAKNNDTEYRGFNFSVGIDNLFMEAVIKDLDYNLHFEGRIYKTVRARELWDKIMKSTWDWAEPGVIFLERMNEWHNLYYCRKITGTNPCSEQPLPPHSNCLLGSINLVKYIYISEDVYYFDWAQFITDIPPIVRMLDNVLDKTLFPLEEQKEWGLKERRLGIGITGLANAGEILGFPYGSPKFLDFEDKILSILKEKAYRTSCLLAKEKGSFPLFDRDKYLNSTFIRTLDRQTRGMINEMGIRNSHLISIAPTGTISLSADNISSGIEPTFSHEFTRELQTFEGPKKEVVKDYMWRVWGKKGKTADQCTIDEHLAVLTTAQKHVDSSISKTCNIGPDVTFEEFKDIYLKAWKQGAKCLSTFRSSGKRAGVLVEKKEEEVACYIDEKGMKSCG